MVSMNADKAARAVEAVPSGAMTNRVRRRILVRGRVQGVGFRWFARDVAEAMGIAGTVRNLRDGRTVEVIAEASPELMARYVEALRSGPPGSYVAGLEEEDIAVDGAFDGFQIIH
jgi:acylphosphatase